MSTHHETTDRSHPFEATRVGDVMHHGVLSCPPDAPLSAVARTMSENRVHSVVVYGWEGDDAAGDVWGVLSTLDLVAAAQHGGEDGDAGSVAASPVVTVEPATRLDRAAQLMAEYRTSHLIVVDPGSSRPLGVLSDLDLARALADAGG